MSDPSVECVLQDHVGFLWAGTDDGLFRFDGRGFTKFSRKQGLPQTRIYQLYETADGRLYAATAAGLARFQGHGFVVVGAPALGAFAVSHQGIASDAAGTVYVGTDRGLFSGKDDRYQEDQEANAVGEGAVGGVHVDAAGALYFARGGLLFRKESGRVVEFGRPRGLPSEETVDEVRSDHDGRLWVRTVKHLYLLPKGGQKFERDDEGLPESSEVGRLAFDDRGASARADRAGPRLQAGRRVAPDRKAGGPVLGRRALGARGPGGLALGRVARRRARPAAGPRRVHQLDPLGRSVAGGGLGDRPPEVGLGARRALGGDRAGTEPAGSGLGRHPALRRRGRPRRQHGGDAGGGQPTAACGSAPGRAASPA